MGLLTSANENGTGMCTAFLIGSDLMATNSHCIPKDIKQDGASCSSRMWVTFPRVGNYERSQIECDRILTPSVISEDATASLDFAFIRLKLPVGRPALEINRLGFPSDETVWINKMNPHTDGGIPEGRLTNVACRPVYGSKLVPGSARAQSGLMTFANCVVIRGNSGSPILDRDGRVRGIIQATFSPSSTLLSELKTTYRLYEELNPLSVGSNLACIRTPDGAPALPFPEACSDHPREAGPAAKKVLETMYLSELDSELRRTGGTFVKNSLGIRWSIDLLNADHSVAKKILRSVLDWTSLNMIAFPAPSCFEGAGSAGGEVQLPVWESETRHNRYLQAVPFVGREFISPLRLRVEISGRQVRLFLPSGEELFGLELSACGR